MVISTVLHSQKLFTYYISNDRIISAINLTNNAYIACVIKKPRARSVSHQSCNLSLQQLFLQRFPASTLGD